MSFDHSLSLAPIGWRPSDSGTDGVVAPSAVDTEPYILMLRSGSEPAPRSLRAHLADFCSEDCISHLTPVLGLETNDGHAIKGQVIHEDPALKKRLRDRPELAAFYRESCKARVAGREFCDFSLEPAQAAEHLTDARFHLLSAAYTTTKLFADTWVKSLSPVTDWHVHSVPIHTGAAETIDTICQDIHKAVEAIDHLCQPEGSEVEEGTTIALCGLLGTTGIRLRLESLTDTFPTLSRLDGALVEWLTDLFWHTLIFESPCYPRPDELAFQLSMCANNSSTHPKRKYEPTAMVQRHADQRFQNAMEQSLRRGMRSGKQQPRARGKLQDAIAASLTAQYHIRSAQPSKLHPFPLAISFAHDLELEKSMAFQPEGCEVFHVAFPVVHAMSTEARSKGTLRWLIGDFPGVLDQPKTAQQVLDVLSRPQNGWRWLNDVVQGDRSIDEGSEWAPPEQSIRGPLILKVSGSPLHEMEEDASTHQCLVPSLQLSIENGELPEPESRVFPLGHLMHVPAVTELDVLQLSQVDDWSRGARQQDSGQHKAGLPFPIVQELMGRDRYWLIVGHDLSDWSARLQLFGQISRSVLFDRSSRALAVSRRADMDRARLLASLNIPITFGAFEELSPHIVRAAVKSLKKAGVDVR